MMAQEPVPTIVVRKGTEVVLALLGVFAAIPAAYYTGQTGKWAPLLAISMALALSMLFVTSER